MGCFQIMSSYIELPLVDAILLLIGHNHMECIACVICQHEYAMSTRYIIPCCYRGYMCYWSIYGILCYCQLQFPQGIFSIHYVHQQQSPTQGYTFGHWTQCDCICVLQLYIPVNEIIDIVDMPSAQYRVRIMVGVQSINLRENVRSY